MRKIAIYRRRLLARSETFIRTQALSLSEWKPVIIGHQLLPDGLRLDGLEVDLLPERKTSWRQELVLNSLPWRPHDGTTRSLLHIGAQLVHAHFGMDAVDIWPSVDRCGLPMLVTLHGYDINTSAAWWEAGNGGDHRRRYPKQLVRLARCRRVHFIAVSRAIKQRAIDFGLPGDNVSVQYIGVDTANFAPGSTGLTSRPKRILFVGRLVEKKGVEYLLKAFPAVMAMIPDAELVIAGDGPLRQSLQDLATASNIPAVFLGAVDQSRVMELMRGSQVFCLPSITAENGDAEGLPIVVLEAAAMGLGIVTSARGAVGEVVLDGINGLCFPEKNVELLAACLSRFLKEEDFLATCAGRARDTVEGKFDLTRCSRELEDLYSSFAGEVGQRHGARRSS
jgi:glycosyltransferase involved in cell wall biosynthesis